MTMKRPVFFPDLDPEKILSKRQIGSVTEGLQAYGEALLECNEPCMEVSESAGEIVRAMRRQHSGVTITSRGEDKYTLTSGDLKLSLASGLDGSVRLSFTPGRPGIDVSDFGPADAAGFIRIVFKSYGNVKKQIDAK